MWLETKMKLTTPTYRLSAATHIGHKRKSNEDRFIVRQMQDGTILAAVADGLGLEQTGDVAAEMARQRVIALKEVPPAREQAHLARLAREIDHEIEQEAQKLPGLNGMGSTLLVLFIRDAIAYWVHVGDSRIYLFRGGRLNQMTEDQTLARFLVAEGELHPRDVPQHYSRKVMDQCVGCGYCEPETGRIDLQPGDLVLMTTDGLHKEISAEQMEAVLKAGKGIESVTEALIESALAAGGADNITVVIAGNGGLADEG